MHVAASSGAIPRSLYFGGDRGSLYAINAQTGELRWCIRLNDAAPQITPPPCPFAHCPSIPSFLIIGTPAVVDGVVYVCVSGSDETGTTYAFNARDGSLRWHTESSCGMNSMAFNNNAIPLVYNGVVYSGLCALRAQDGQVLWKESRANIVQEGAYMPLAEADGVLYVSTQAAVYALNAADGSVRWRYPPHAYMTVGGLLAVSVSNQTLIVGTEGSVDQPETSAAYAVNIGNGSLRWYHLMGDYKGAVLFNNVAYVSSGDEYMYALNAVSGNELWRTKLAYSPWYGPVLAQGILYTNSNGAYAIDSSDGKILWHQLLGADQSFSFGPSVVVDGIDYLSGTDGHGTSGIYALNAKTGAEYWHSAGINQISPPAAG